MRILFLTSSFTPWCRDSVSHQARLFSDLAQKADFQLLCPIDTLDYAFAQRSGIEHTSEYSLGDAIKLLGKAQNSWLTRLVESSEVLVFHSVRPLEFPLWTWYALKKKIPFFIHWSEEKKRRPYLFFLKKLFQGWQKTFPESAFRGFLTGTSEEAEGLKKLWGENAPITVLPEIVLPWEKVPPLSTPFPVESKPFYLFLATRFSKADLKFFLRAFAIYTEKGGKAFGVFAPLNTVVSDELIQRLVRRFHLQSRIRLHAPLEGEDRELFLKRAVGVLGPRKQSGVDPIFVESILRHGVGFTCQKSATERYFGNWYGGRFYACDDPGHLANLWLAQESKKPAPEVDEEAIAWMRKEWSIEKVGRQYWELFTSLRNPRAEEVEKTVPELHVP